MSSIMMLRAAMTAQVLLGLVRFIAPLVGAALPDGVWLVHPLLGTGIAVAAMWLLRDRPGQPMTGRRRAARFAVLLPLGIGLAKLAGLASGSGLVLAHMAAGLFAIKLVDDALLREPSPAAEPVPSGR